MTHNVWQRREGELHVEDVALRTAAAELGTPLCVYSSAHMRSQLTRLRSALGDLEHRICYAVKANSNLSLLQQFHSWDCDFDIVSAGELQRVISAGGNPSGVVFSGVGKSSAEIDFALKHEIGCFNVESASELQRIAARAELLGRRAPISIRVNPNVDAGTHPYISTGLKQNKFGVPEEVAEELYLWAAKQPHLDIVGIDCHIGSQIEELGPFAQALDALLALIDRLADQGVALQHLDMGGGLGVTYRDEAAFDVDAYGRLLQERLANRNLTLLLEPGRFLVANAGVLLTTVEYLKPTADADGKNFAIIDAAMNDLLRPALYQAWHEIEPVGHDPAVPTKSWELVGPICESGDFLGAERTLALQEGDLLAIHSAGAYGMRQSSNYNTRSRAAEALVSGSQCKVVRRRETIRDQLAPELETLQGDNQ